MKARPAVALNYWMPNSDFIPRGKKIFPLLLSGLIYMLLFFSSPPSTVQADEEIDWESLPYVFELESRFVVKEETHMGAKRGIGLSVVDIDNDEQDEFLLAYKWGENRYTLTCYEGSLENFKWIHTQRESMFPPYCASLDNTDSVSVIVASKENTIIWLSVFNSRGDKRQTLKIPIGEDNDKSGIWDGDFHIQGALDLNGDGYKEIIASVNSGYDRRPRGIYAYDLKAEKELWNYQTGPGINEVIIDPGDDGRKPRILCSTAAFANSNVAYQDDPVKYTEDKKSYVILIDHTGELIWQEEIGGRYSRSYANLCDIDRDGSQDIITAMYSGDAEFHGTYKISIWSIEQDGPFIVAKEDSGYASFTNIALGDLTGDGSEEIVIGALDGQIRIYSSGLDLMTKKRFEAGISASSILDLDHQTKPSEIIASTQDRKTLVLHLGDENEIEVSAKFDDVGILRSLQTEKGKQPKLLLLSHDFLYILRFTKRLLPPFPTGFFAAGIAIGVVIIFGVVAAIERHRRRKPHFRFKDRFFDFIASGLITINNKGKITLCNPKAREILHLGNETLVGLDFEETLRRYQLDNIIALIEDLQKKSKEGEPEEVWLKVGDESKDVLLSMEKLRDKNGQEYGKQITFEDVTEIVRSKGNLVQRLAHNLKTPVGKIKLHTQSFHSEWEARKISDADGLDDYTHFIVQQSDQLAEMITGFTKIIGLEKPNFVRANVNGLIEHVMEGYRKSSPDHLHFKTVLDSQLPSILVDTNHFSTILSNLIENAIHAMPDGGTLTISTSQAVSKVNESGEENGKFITIEVSDTGIGISEEDLQSVFNPYFTTSRGSGIGLTIVNQLVSEHQGTTNIKSRLGIGTTVYIRLPIKRQMNS